MPPVVEELLKVLGISVVPVAAFLYIQNRLRSFLDKSNEEMTATSGARSECLPA